MLIAFLFYCLGAKQIFSVEVTGVEYAILKTVSKLEASATAMTGSMHHDALQCWTSLATVVAIAVRYGLTQGMVHP